MCENITDIAKGLREIAGNISLTTLTFVCFSFHPAEMISPQSLSGSSA